MKTGNSIGLRQTSGWDCDTSIRQRRQMLAAPIMYKLYRLKLMQVAEATSQDRN
jgi:hypothetical protein